MLARMLCVAVAGGAVLLAFSTREQRGKDLFMRRCSGCHALEVNRRTAACEAFTVAERRARRASRIPMP